MFGFLKNLLRKSPDSPVEAQQFEPEPSAEQASDSMAEAVPQPQRAPAQGFRAAPARKNLAQPSSTKAIGVPLRAILEGLPLELQPRVRQTDVGDAAISVPLEKILAQLARGAVKIYFGELRQSAPQAFSSENDRDRVLVSLPLAEILTRLNPALITRRRVQRQVEIPPEIASPFDLGPEGQVVSVAPPKPEPQPARNGVPPQRANHPAPAPAATPRAPLVTARTPSAPHATPSISPPRHSLTSVPTPPAPAASHPGDAPAAPAPIPIRPSAPRPAAPRPASAPVTPAAAPQPPQHKALKLVPSAPMNAVESPTEELIEAAHVHAPAAAPAPAAPAPVEPAPASSNGVEPLLVGLSAIAEGWPETVRKEILDLHLVDAKVALPANAIEQALKQGRVAFSWKTIRFWIKPAVPQTASTHDSLVVELPLRVIAPLFLGRKHEPSNGQQKVAVDEEIPNLFFGFPKPESTPAPPTARPTDTNFYVWDDGAEMLRVDETGEKKIATPGTKFVAKYATPNEVVSRAAALDGVVGALIALPDGLMVANRLPPEVNADTLAAFLPQIFGKVSQGTKELRMGELNNLNFTVGNIPWKIFRVHSIFFAAFGRAGEPLPTAQLAALAAELDHKPK